ncbi:uncharacterized protein TNIN_241931 [Trichonephila inaurata madagascariensis]|uniref:Transcription factor IIIC 90kDa subunit N-terminal domain-containing protein n=1 Tax=Trichonephila inaurata madagascariensis TaxID=2747483 RepID=A0A8X6XVN0_9ARAC|nr:uncharacterized protein TNIN_241931 [Trichonephila inaurata madagascariensis]
MAAISLIQSFNLPGEISCRFALDWSSDNKIAVCTSKTIYVLNSFCSPVETGFPFPLHKQVIQIPDEAMQLNPAYVPSNPYRFIHSEEDRENVYSVMMDHSLSSTPTERTEVFRSFRCCKWSPKGAAGSGRCLLATLTMDHRLALYEEYDKEWKCICDMTELLKKEMVPERAHNISESRQNKSFRRKKKRESKHRTRSKKASYHEDTDEDEEEFDDEDPCNFSKHMNYEKLINETYKYAPIEITWTGMFSGTPNSMNEKSYEFCFLIVAMKSGHIQFWKVSASEGRVISLLYEWDTGLGLVTTLSWQQTSLIAGFLMCGSIKGILAFLPVAVVMDPEEEPKIAVKNMCKIWDEEDMVPVDHIAVLKIALRKYACVAVKQYAVIGCEIILTEDSIFIRNVGHAFGLHKLPITGMAVLDARSIPQYRVLMSTMEGKLIEVKITLGEEEINFQHDLIPIDLDLNNAMIQGLALSSNGFLCGLILNTAVYYDHLEKKEPLQFAMYVTKPVDEIFGKLKNMLKPQVSFLPATSTDITNHSDYLDIIRITLATGAALPKWLTDFMENDPTTYENCSTTELYFKRFILQAYASGLAVAAPTLKGPLELKLYAVEAIIMRNYISKIFRSCQDNLDLLSPGQGQSLLLMADWLFKEFHMPVESLYSALGCETPSDPESLPARETCDICKTDVKLDNIKVGQCSKNHQFARCCQSLLLCDIVPYNQCPSCKSVALKNLWNFDSYCTYCGMMMLST